MNPGKKRNSPKSADAYFNELIHEIVEIAPDKNLLKKFFIDLLTPAEQKAIPKRWQIVKRLHAGASQREVATEFKVSIATITRGSRTLLNKSGGFNKVLGRRASS